jgi:phosphopantetheinyl transferase
MDSTLEDSFFELWTAKEALLKAMGSGFLVNPAEVSLLPDQRDSSRHTVSIPGEQPQSWSVFNLDVGKEFKAAAAAQGTIETMFLIPLEPENTISC